MSLFDKDSSRMPIRLTAAAAALLALAAAAPAAAQTYNFDLGGGYFDTTPSTITAPAGYTVTFTSTDASGDGGGSGFYIGPNNGLFSTLGSQILVDPSTGGDTLTLTFSSAITGLAFNFGLEDILGLNGDDTLTVTAGSYTQTYGSSIPNGDLFPQGSVAFNDPNAFTTVTISATEAFDIGLTDVPEPASLGMLGAGLVGLVAARRRRIA
jgi:plastocyanin